MTTDHVVGVFHQLDDGTRIPCTCNPPKQIRLTIYGAPRTKKTSNVTAIAGNKPGGRAIVLPSKLWRQWCKDARVVGYKEGSGYPFLWPETGRQLPERPYNCAAIFYRERNAGDAVGYYQGLADLLETRGVLFNDKWVTQWDGSRLLKDDRTPRVELVLSAVIESALDQPS